MRTLKGHFPPPLQAAKWISLQALLSSKEMHGLIGDMERLGNFSIFPTQPVSFEERTVDPACFLEEYAKYVERLQQGEIPDPSHFRPFFSTVWSRDQDAVLEIPLEGKCCFRAVKPVVQLQAHKLGYSPLDGKFRSMVFGQDTIDWGIQFSYPQLFQDPASKEIEKVGEHYPNTSLFQCLRKWMRVHTLPVPFTVGGREITVPVRIGRECLMWIDHHPQLKILGIGVIPK